MNIHNLIENKDRHYSYAPIPKNNGKMRWLEIPDDELKKVQRLLLRTVVYKFKPSDIVYSYRKRLSSIDAAKLHLGAQSMLHLDIVEFFRNIKESAVLNFFSKHIAKFNLPFGVSLRDFVELVTLKKHLPTGAPTSPAISNVVCYALDKALSDIAIENSFKVSRYADDIVFSSRNRDAFTKSTIKRIKSVIRAFNFIINVRKTRIRHQGQQMMVNGIVINDVMNVPKKKAKKLRATLHNLKGQTIDENDYLKLRGQVEWINAVNPQKGQQFLKMIGEVKYNI